MAGIGLATVRVGRLRLTVHHSDEYYLFVGRAHTNLTERWRALFARYFLPLSCWPSGLPTKLREQLLSLVIGTGTVMVWEWILPGEYSAKKTKSNVYCTKNQWKFPEWARERVTRVHLGGPVQLDGYWSKDHGKRLGPYLRGPTDDVMPRHYGTRSICQTFGDVVYVTVPATTICGRKRRCWSRTY